MQSKPLDDPLEGPNCEGISRVSRSMDENTDWFHENLGFHTKKIKFLVLRTAKGRTANKWAIAVEISEHRERAERQWLAL